MPRIFISYSHDSQAHRDAVLEFADELRRRGFDAMIDQYVVDPDEGWPRWMKRQLTAADFVLVVPTAPYLVRWNGEAPAGIGLGATWEGLIVTNRLYQAGGVARGLRCVLVGDARKDCIPEELSGHTHFQIPERFSDLENYIRGLPIGASPGPLGPQQVLARQWNTPATNAWDRKRALFEFLLNRFTVSDLVTIVTFLPEPGLEAALPGEGVGLSRYSRDLVNELTQRGTVCSRDWWSALERERPNFREQIAELEGMWR